MLPLHFFLLLFFFFSKLFVVLGVSWSISCSSKFSSACPSISPRLFPHIPAYNYKEEWKALEQYSCIPRYLIIRLASLYWNTIRTGSGAKSSTCSVGCAKIWNRLKRGKVNATRLFLLTTDCSLVINLMILLFFGKFPLFIEYLNTEKKL